MPAPRWLAHLNKRITNRILGLLVARVPPFVGVEHVGRRSGRRYETVVWAFRAPHGWVVALTYGSRSDWVRNVLAAGRARVRHVGGTDESTSPRLVRGAEAAALLPPSLRTPLRWLCVDEALVLPIG